MEEFLLKHYSLITHSVEFLAAITGVFCLKKYKHSVARYFILFLVLIAFFDFANIYTKFVHPDKFLSFLIGTKFEKNHWWSTLYWDIGAILFFIFYYNKVLKKQIFKSIIEYVGYGFFIFSIIYIAINWQVFFNQFFAVFDVLGALIVSLCCVFYFIEVLLTDKILSFYSSLNFYVTVAIFVWWLIITPLTFYDVYFTYEVGKSFVDKNFVFLRWQIFLFANIFMYSTFIFALIFCKPENNSIETAK